MKLDIRFVGVRANDLLVERIYELFEEQLGQRLSEIDSVTLLIGKDSHSDESENVCGQGIILLCDGKQMEVNNSSSKIMHLTDLCLERLDQHFADFDRRKAELQLLRQAVVPALLTFHP